MTDRPDWAVEGRDWPNRPASRFMTVEGFRWHVQVAGEGPALLLLHGAGAATHSWRDLLPRLAERFTVVAPDLPGHGFTGMPSDQRLSLPAMAARVTALTDALEIRPAMVVGHSAGAAIALRLSLDGRLGAAPVVAINGALQPFAGAVAPLFQGLAMSLFAKPLAVRLFALGARDRGRVARMIRGTGSHIDDAGLALYASLLQKPGQVAGTLGMMGNWDLRELRRDLPGLKTPLTLLVGSRDLAVPPSVADSVVASVPAARIVSLPGLGHLAHEEAPDRVAAILLDEAVRHGVLEASPA